MSITLPYTEAQSEAAHKAWKASCGHHSIAAATGRSLDDVKNSGIKLCGWMNPSMVSQCLQSMRIEHEMVFVHPGRDVFREILEGGIGQPRIFRIQFQGPWMKGPVAAQYKHTHYIACFEQGIMDPIGEPCQIHNHTEWLDLVEGLYPFVIKKCTGWCFTHVWKIARFQQPQTPIPNGL